MQELCSQKGERLGELLEVRQNIVGGVRFAYMQRRWEVGLEKDEMGQNNFTAVCQECSYEHVSQGNDTLKNEHCIIKELKKTSKLIYRNSNLLSYVAYFHSGERFVFPLR